MFEIKRESYPVPQRPEDQVKHCAFCMYPTYAYNNGIAMLEIRNNYEMWRSEDNGANWNKVKQLQVEEKVSDQEYRKWNYGPLVHDPIRDILISFEYRVSYRSPIDMVTDYFTHCEFFINESTMNFYRLSHDGGLTWSDKRPFIQDGPEFNEKDYSERHNSMGGFIQFGEVPPYLTDKDEALILPFQGRSQVNSDTEGSIQAGRFFGEWDESARDYRWKVAGGYVPGGGCEQTIERLKDGRLLNILRVQGEIEPYYFDLRYRPFSISDDDGKNWSKPSPLKWDDGEHIVSPRSWSRLIRATSGKLYWIANILPDLDKLNENIIAQLKHTGRADPRYPLVMAEVDEVSLTLKRDTETVIIDREPGETEYVRFSNFFCYNDRKSGEIVLYLMKCYHENKPDIENMPHPAWRYRIKVL